MRLPAMIESALVDTVFPLPTVDTEFCHPNDRPLFPLFPSLDPMVYADREGREHV